MGQWAKYDYGNPWGPDLHALSTTCTFMRNELWGMSMRVLKVRSGESIAKLGEMVPAKWRQYIQSVSLLSSCYNRIYDSNYRSISQHNSIRSLHRSYDWKATLIAQQSKHLATLTSSLRPAPVSTPCSRPMQLTRRPQVAASPVPRLNTSASLSPPFSLRTDLSSNLLPKVTVIGYFGKAICTR